MLLGFYLGPVNEDASPTWIEGNVFHFSFTQTGSSQASLCSRFLARKLSLMGQESGTIFLFTMSFSICCGIWASGLGIYITYSEIMKPWYFWAIWIACVSHCILCVPQWCWLRFAFCSQDPALCVSLTCCHDILSKQMQLNNFWASGSVLSLHRACRIFLFSTDLSDIIIPS